MFKEPHRRFLEFLQSKSLKCTAQRLLVLDVMLSGKEHRSVEDIHGVSRRSDPSIGLATVYRTLKLLEEAGLILSHTYDAGVVHYEAVDMQGHHDHLICQQCGAVVDVLDEDIECLQKGLAERHGYVLCAHRMYLYGLCPACQEGGESGDPSKYLDQNGGGV